MHPLTISTQPDDETCGPTSLQAVYRYYQNDYPLDQLIREITSVKSGGTITPYLAIHAIKQGYQTCLYAYNINIFDPSWFYPKKISARALIDKLEQQLKYKVEKRMQESIQAYIEYLALGGEVVYKDLSVNLLKYYFDQKTPIITALSATYLYQSQREIVLENGKVADDDIRGVPCGHFVVLCDYDHYHRRVIVADPHRQNPISHDNYYLVSSVRLINAIMLGVLTYDANLLIVKPKRGDHE